LFAGFVKGAVGFAIRCHDLGVFLVPAAGTGLAGLIVPTFRDQPVPGVPAGFQPAWDT